MRGALSSAAMLILTGRPLGEATLAENDILSWRYRTTARHSDEGITFRWPSADRNALPLYTN